MMRYNAQHRNNPEKFNGGVPFTPPEPFFPYFPSIYPPRFILSERHFTYLSFAPHARYDLQLKITSQILSTSSAARSAYSGSVSTLLLMCSAVGVSFTSYSLWKQENVFVRG